MPTAKLVMRLCLFTALLCTVLVGLALGIGIRLPRSELAFVSNRDGDSEIYVMDVQRGILRNLTRNPASDEFPAWSPDGNRIAFVSNRNSVSSIYVMDTNGQHPRLVYNGSGFPLRHLAWSPDGGRIAFDWQADGDDEIYLYDLQSQTLSQLTENDIPDRSPTWSPDASSIVFASSDTLFSIYIMNADGSNIREFFDPAHVAYLLASWSPDGHHLALTRSRDHIQAIYITNPLDTTLLFSQTDAENRVEVELFQLTNFDNTGDDDSPAWSYDGRQIAFVSQGDSITPDIWIVNIDGTGLWPITKHLADDISPAWRP